MGKFIVGGQGGGHHPGAKSRAMVVGGQRQVAPQPQQQAPVFKVRPRGGGAPISRSMGPRPAGRPSGGAGGLGDPNARTSILHCVKCGKGVTPNARGRVDEAMMAKDGTGPFCKDCWVHVWIPHTWANVTEGPPCMMGVRFEDHDYAEIQTRMWRVYQSVGARFPSEQEMDSVLNQIRKSYVCPACHENIVFDLEAKNFKLAGITPGVPWPQGTAYPWQLQQTVDNSGMGQQVPPPQPPPQQFAQQHVQQPVHPNQQVLHQPQQRMLPGRHR